MHVWDRFHIRPSWLRMPLLFVLLVLLLAGELFLPGYILTLDLVWTPEMVPRWNESGFNNGAPISFLVWLLTLLMPSSGVEKIYLASLLFMLFFIPWKYLPWIRHPNARLFSAILFVSNPFVYARFLSGQWGHLFGYAFLPMLLSALLRLESAPGIRAGIRWGLALCGIGLFSIHFLYLGLIFSVFWIGAHSARLWIHSEKNSFRKLLIGSSAGFALFFITSLYWIIPALSRKTPIENRFGTAHLEAFAASGHDMVPIFANVAVGGGFWGEGTAWATLFDWPQHFLFFWCAAAALFFLIGLGISRGLTLSSHFRFASIFLLTAGVLSFVLALGAAPTPLSGINLFLYEHIPGWSGLRDSHKIAAFLMLVCTIFAGLGIERMMLGAETMRPLARYISLLIFFSIPVLFGAFLWGGAHGQLTPHPYPIEWYEARRILDHEPSARVLALPWHGYLSLPFAENRIVANPAARFFGAERVIQSRRVEIAGIRDQEVDTQYRRIDELVSQLAELSPPKRSERLREAGFTHVLEIISPAISPESDGIFSWEPIEGNMTPTAKDSASPPSLFEVFSGKPLIDGYSVKLLRL